jgi:23S rRNA G2445 N2-methylase RlmL
MIKVIDPKVGERIYDGACGSAGFLCEAFEYLLPKADSTTARKALQEKTFFGKEKKSLAYVIGIMNMILHGIEAPNIVHTNTLAENISDIQDKDRYDIALANPPFGGKERPEVQQNFPIKTGETAFLFLQHFIKSLKAGGRAAIVIKEHVSLEHRQRLGGAAQGAAGELQPAYGAGHAGRHVPGRRRQDRGAVFRERRAHAQDLVLQARSWPQSRQDQPSQRRRPEGLCRVAGQV